LSTTQIYTRVSVRHLKEVHDKVHPASQKVDPDDLEPPKADNLEPPDPDAV